jgi:hypothetical protein
MSIKMWKVWHGNLYGANIALNSFYDGVDVHTVIAEADSRGSAHVEQVRERLTVSFSLRIVFHDRVSLSDGRRFQAKCAEH